MPSFLFYVLWYTPCLHNSLKVISRQHSVVCHTKSSLSVLSHTHPFPKLNHIPDSAGQQSSPTASGWMERLAAVQVEAVEAGKLAATMAAGSIVKSDGVRLTNLFHWRAQNLGLCCHTGPLLCWEIETSLWMWLHFSVVERWIGWIYPHQ